MKQKRYCLECGRELPDEWYSDLCEDCMNNLASALWNSDDLIDDI